MGYNEQVQKLKQWSVLSFLLLIFFAASWSLLITSKFFRVHDFTHAGRISEMAQALQDGHFPVRWTENFGYGYGMPLFEFYGPLPFYIGAVVFILFGNVIWSIKFLYLLSNLGTLLGGYFLGKKLFGRVGGLLLSAFLTLAPYRAMNLFARGALNEVWGIMFLPWILLGLLQIFHQQKNGWKTFFLSLVGLFLSHNITTMIFLPILTIFSLGYGGLMFWQQAPEFFRKGRFRARNVLRIIWQMFITGVLAIAAASFYLVPAFFEKSFTQVEKIILTPYFDYHLHFLYIRQFFTPNWGYGGSGWGTEDGISFFLGWGQLLAVFSLLALWIYHVFLKIMKKEKKKVLSRKVVYLTFLFGIIFLLSSFMSLLKTQFIWDNISLFKFIQFPWRWMSISILFLSILLASRVWLFTNIVTRSWTAGICIVITVFSSAIYFQPEKYLDDANDFYYTDKMNIRKNLSQILPDYISTDMKENPTIIPESLILNQDLLADESVEIITDRVHEKLIKTSFTETTNLEFSVATYPGWRAEIDSQWWSKSKGENRNIMIEVPSGNHLVSLRFESTPIRHWSDLTSFFAWIVFIYFSFPTLSEKILKNKKFKKL